MNPLIHTPAYISPKLHHARQNIVIDGYKRVIRQHKQAITAIKKEVRYHEGRIIVYTSRGVTGLSLELIVNKHKKSIKDCMEQINSHLKEIEVNLTHINNIIHGIKNYQALNMLERLDYNV